MNQRGRGVSRLTSGPSVDGEPTFSAEGNRVVFKRSKGSLACEGMGFTYYVTNYELFIVELDGSNVTRLTADPATDEGPAYAPDGGRIYFSRRPATCASVEGEIYAMAPLAGAPAQPVTANVDLTDKQPSVSHDGGRIAFTRSSDLMPIPPSEGVAVYTMRTNGTEETRLANGFDPAFSPDGRQIVFERGQPGGGVGEDRLLIMSRSGSGVRRLTDDGHSPDWGPAPQRTPTGRCSGIRATILGTGGADRIRGTSGRDVIQARGGNDSIVGRGGVDRICGGPGDDTGNGGMGPDRLIGGQGDDLLRGNRSRDALLGLKGFDRCFGGKGRDAVRCERST